MDPKELRKYKKIPSDVKDAKYDLMMSDPRAYVIDVAGYSHACTFSDDLIRGEAENLFWGLVARWMGINVEVFSSETVKDVVSRQAPSFDETEPTYGKTTVAPVEDPASGIRAKWEGEFGRISRRLGLSPPRFERRLDRVRFVWVNGPYWVRVVLRFGESPFILVETEVTGRRKYQFSYQRLRASLLDLDPLLDLEDL